MQSRGTRDRSYFLRVDSHPANVNPLAELGGRPWGADTTLDFEPIANGVEGAAQILAGAE
jgi:hypothetical protein